MYKRQDKVVTPHNSLTRVCFRYNYNYRYKNGTNMTTKEKQLKASRRGSVRYVTSHSEMRPIDQSGAPFTNTLEFVNRTAH